MSALAAIPKSINIVDCHDNSESLSFTDGGEEIVIVEENSPHVRRRKTALSLGRALKGRSSRMRMKRSIPNVESAKKRDPANRNRGAVRVTQTTSSSSSCSSSSPSSSFSSSSSSSSITEEIVLPIEADKKTLSVHRDDKNRSNSNSNTKNEKTPISSLYFDLKIPQFGSFMSEPSISDVSDSVCLSDSFPRKGVDINLTRTSSEMSEISMASPSIAPNKRSLRRDMVRTAPVYLSMSQLLTDDDDDDDEDDADGNNENNNNNRFRNSNKNTNHDCDTNKTEELLKMPERKDTVELLKMPERKDSFTSFRQIMSDAKSFSEKSVSSLLGSFSGSFSEKSAVIVDKIKKTAANNRRNMDGLYMPQRKPSTSGVVDIGEPESSVQNTDADMRHAERVFQHQQLKMKLKTRRRKKPQNSNTTNVEDGKLSNNNGEEGTPRRRSPKPQRLSQQKNELSASKLARKAKNNLDALASNAKRKSKINTNYDIHDVSESKAPKIDSHDSNEVAGSEQQERNVENNDTIAYKPVRKMSLSEEDEVFSTIRKLELDEEEFMKGEVHPNAVANSKMRNISIPQRKPSRISLEPQRPGGLGAMAAAAAYHRRAEEDEEEGEDDAEQYISHSPQLSRRNRTASCSSIGAEDVEQYISHRRQLGGRRNRRASCSSIGATDVAAAYYRRAEDEEELEVAEQYISHRPQLSHKNRRASCSSIKATDAAAAYHRRAEDEEEEEEDAEQYQLSHRHRRNSCSSIISDDLPIDRNKERFRGLGRASRRCSLDSKIGLAKPQRKKSEASMVSYKK